MRLSDSFRREQMEAIARHIMTPNPIMVRMMKRIDAEEARRWLLGATDVGMHTSYVQRGWGEDDLDAPA